MGVADVDRAARFYEAVGLPTMRLQAGAIHCAGGCRHRIMSTFYPRFYAVNDRPMKLHTLPTGELEVLVVDPVTGMLARDMSYLSRTAEHGIGKDIDALTEAEFEARRIALWQAASQRRHNRTITWSNTGDGEFPYRTELDGHTLIVRVNDFPAEPLYTLLINDVEVEDLEDWPKAWVRPGRPSSGAW